MTSSHSRKSLLPAIIAFTGLGAIIYWALFQGVFELDENHPQAHFAIVKLSLSQKAAVPIGTDSNHLPTKSFDSMTAYAESNGWQLDAQYGAMLIYKKQNPQRSLHALCGLYSPLYMTCHIDKEI